MNFKASQIAHLQRNLRNKVTSFEAVAEQALKTAHGTACQNAFIHINDEAVLPHAKAFDQLALVGAPTGALVGVPVTVKDLFDVAGQATMSGSVVAKGEPIPETDAVAVKRLRDANAMVIGRTNMTEFAFSGVGINPHWGTPHNPEIGRAHV